MVTTKTTFYLSEDLRFRLKALAARRRTTMTELLVEGAEAVLARYGAMADREELLHRASEARRRLREGLYEGRSVSDSADDVVYGAPERTGDDA